MSHKRPTGLFLLFFTILAALVLALPGTATSAQPPGKPGTGSATGWNLPGSATGWYLALGDSLAAGLQPGLGDDHDGGYVGPVLEAVRDSAPKTDLENLGCSGETSATLVDGGICDYEVGSQLDQALAFLRSHPSTTRLVTVTVGANDVTPCLKAPDVNGCVATVLHDLSVNLTTVLSEVRAAAPQARIVVTNYYNPYLVAWFKDPAQAVLTTVLLTAVNNTIAAATATVDGVTADVAWAFRSSVTTPVPMGPLAGAPTNVATICQLTYMCTIGNIHPNDDGYATIAGAVRAKLS